MNRKLRRHPRSARASQTPTVAYSATRPLFLIACFLVLAVATICYVDPRGHAQSIHDNSEAAFAHKADKNLKLIRSAVAADRSAVARGKFAPQQSMVDQTSRFAAVARQGDVTSVGVIVDLGEANTDELANAGFPIQARNGNIATLELNVDRLPKLASLNSVRKIFAATLRRPLNDRARQSSGIDNGSGQRVLAQTGRGVVVGFIDTGIDFRHLDFTVPGSSGHETRIKALLDMTVYGNQSPDPNWNYSLPGQSSPIGHLYTPADLNSALQLAKPADQNTDTVKQRDKNGHGTHVAAIAAGNGLSSPTAGTYAGMAPEADLVVVKTSRENDGDDNFRTTDIINAIEFIRQKAAELGEPFVINISLGSQGGPHDGTNPDERFIDDLVNGGTGRAVCIAAGNEGDSSIHARSTVPAGGSQTLDFNINGAADFIDLYQSSSDRFTVTVTWPDGTTLGPVAYDANGFSQPDGQASDQYLQIYNTNDDKGDSDAANDQPDIFIIFKPGAPNGMWKIKLQDADNNSNQSYDAWAEGQGVYFSTFMDVTSHLISSPGAARNAITIGAFVTRSSSSSQTLGAIASFSSPGPTADGRQKPELSAPGYYLYSARSSDADPNFGVIGTGSDAPSDSTHYTGLAGTSMATPVAAGSVALLLQSSPGLSGNEIKNLLTTYAAQDIFTGSAWSPRFGFGKLNIANSINRSGGGLKKFSITGRVADPDGHGVISLQVFLSGSSSAMAITDANGAFGFTNLTTGGNYQVAPSLQPSMIFTPASYTFNNLSGDQTANFTRTATEVYSISGRITDPFGNPISGVEVQVPGSFTVSGHLPILPAFTNINGYYEWTSLPKGQDYNVTPTFSNSLFTFTPVSVLITSLSSNHVLNFVGTPANISFTGRVTDGVNGLSGVLITLTAAVNSQSVTAITDSNGYYTFSNIAAGLLYTISALKTNYVFTPPSQTLYIYQNTLPQTFVGKVDNQIDHTQFFVTQHYRDFFSREPDAGGLNFWMGNVDNCTPTPQCIEPMRINVSASFFLSIEFKETGYLVERIYKAAYGDATGSSTWNGLHQMKVPIVRFNEFLPDTQKIGAGVIVLQPGWEQLLESNKQAFMSEFVSRSRFTSAFATNLTPAEFVDILFANAEVTPSSADRNAAIAEFGSAANTIDSAARGRALRRVAENSSLAVKEFNRAFVLMQYFGYLRRNPNDPQDTDYTGYDFWLTKLNQFNGNYINSEMVKAFLSSIEYRQRFGP